MKERPLTRPWSEIREYYEELTKYPKIAGTSIAAMAGLVKEIENSRYVKDIHAWTSMHSLCIVQSEVFYPYWGPHLCISPIADGKLEFRFIDSYVEKEQWVRTVGQNEGFRRLEKFFDQLHWFRFG